MQKKFKYHFWIGMGGGLILFCTPIGIYTWLQGIKLQRRLKIGDFQEADKCLKHIKFGWGVAMAFYALIIILGASGAFD